MNWHVKLCLIFSLDDVYNQITKEDIVVDYIQQCENVFAKFNVLNPHVDDYPECLRKFLGRKIWRDSINAISKMRVNGYYRLSC